MLSVKIRARTGMQGEGSSISRQAKVMLPHDCVVIQRADEDILPFLPQRGGGSPWRTLMPHFPVLTLHIGRTSHAYQEQKVVKSQGYPSTVTTKNPCEITVYVILVQMVDKQHWCPADTRPTLLGQQVPSAFCTVSGMSLTLPHYGGKICCLSLWPHTRKFLFQVHSFGFFFKLSFYLSLVSFISCLLIPPISSTHQIKQNLRENRV